MQLIQKYGFSQNWVKSRVASRGQSESVGVKECLLWISNLYIHFLFESSELIRRFVELWPEVFDFFETEADLDLSPKNLVPNDEDIWGSIEAIFRLQEVYDLRAWDLANGLELGG